MIKRNAKLCLALGPALIFPFLASLFYFVLLEGGRSAQLVYGAAKVFLLAWPVICAVLLLDMGFPRFHPRNRAHWHALPIGLFMGAVIAAAMYGLTRSPLGQVIAIAAGPIRAKAQALGILDHYWAFALFLSVFHSLMEEYYWRWFVYGQLRRELRLAPALAAAGVAFAAHHAVVLSQFFPLGIALPFAGLIALAGVMWSAMVEEQKTLAGAWASHMVVDLAVMGIGYGVIAG